jgi:hypothetical protein
LHHGHSQLSQSVGRSLLRFHSPVQTWWNYNQTAVGLYIFYMVLNRELTTCLVTECHCCNLHMTENKQLHTGLDRRYFHRRLLIELFHSLKVFVNN